MKGTLSLIKSMSEHPEGEIQSKLDEVLIKLSTVVDVVQETKSTVCAMVDVVQETNSAFEDDDDSTEESMCLYCNQAKKTNQNIKICSSHGCNIFGHRDCIKQKDLHFEDNTITWYCKGCRKGDNWIKKIVK